MSRTRRNVEDLVSERRTGAGWVPDDQLPRRRRKSSPGMGMYGDWFLDDLGRSLPYGRGIDPGFQLKLSPADAAATEMILEALPVRGYPHSLIADAFRDFIETSIYHLAKGSLFLELEFLYEDLPSQQPPVAFRLHFLPAETTRRRFASFSRLLLVGDEITGYSWVREPVRRENLIEARLPFRLRRRLRRTMALLQSASRQSTVATDFVVGRHGADTGFEVKAHQDLLNDLVLRATREIGWAGRGAFLEGMLDPEKGWRAIQFARLQIKLRDVAFGGLQEAIRRAGQRIGFEGRLVLSQVLTQDELDQLESDMASGTRPIVDAINPMHVVAESNSATEDGA